MALSAEEQKLYDWAKGVLPKWFFKQPRTEEMLHALVKIFDKSRQTNDLLIDNTYILDATGTPAPDWLQQHARDRNSRRASGEGDPAIQQRLRTFPEQVTRPAIMSAVQEVLDSEAAGTAYMVELPIDGAYFREDAISGFTESYMNRGYRMFAGKPGFAPCGFIIILPFGTSASAIASVTEQVAAKKAGGYRGFVEVRTTP